MGVQQPPDCAASNPDNCGESYAFLSFGRANGNNVQYEVKTTTWSRSVLDIRNAGAGATDQSPMSSEIQLVRLGEYVIALHRLPGELWEIHQRYHRDDLPDQLQVGLVSYTDWQKVQSVDEYIHNSTLMYPGMPVNEDPTPGVPINPDLVAGFEYIRFYRPTLPDELMGVNLLDETIATDDLLLSVLGRIAAISEPGDVNNDGIVNFLDITPFINAQSAEGDEEAFLLVTPDGCFLCADIDMDGAIDFLDITPYVNLLDEVGAAAVPEPTSMAILAVLIFGARRRRKR